jgi:hypothetical protein
MGRQWNTIIESLGPLSGGTGLSINANLTDIEALLTTLQADVADGIRLPNATTGGTGPTTFTSTSYGTIATASTGRLGCQVFNEGAGNLHITLGTATTSTSSYTVRLSAGDYYEVPSNYTGLIGGIFATAGTARVTEVN